MIEAIIFLTIILLYTLWRTMRLEKKVDMLGQMGALILTQLSRRYTVDKYPEEELEQAADDWESWDKE
tara:strand:+ start:623 stop:826 length:204 start_codon:yes stop_codon:yes gene_type:complete